MANAAPAGTIDHALYMVAEQRKRDLLEHVLRGDDCDSAIVFTRTKHRAKRLADQLSKAGHRAVGLQGNMSQSQRDRAMRGFRSRSYDILVATDIAARGIDVSGVSHVINFDVPNTPEAYTHRIGRTGRAELEGVACTFVTNSDRAWVKSTERMIGTSIPRRHVEGFSQAEGTSERRQSHGQSRNYGQPRTNGQSRNGGKPRSSSPGDRAAKISREVVGAMPDSVPAAGGAQTRLRSAREPAACQGLAGASFPRALVHSGSGPERPYTQSVWIDS